MDSRRCIMNTSATEHTPFLEVELDGKLQLGVNARELHTMLEVKSDFSHWIKRRIKQCGFEENFDYSLVVKKDEQVSGAKYLSEYIISVDMAKHLGMMERNAKGHEIRKYYIEQENIARDTLNGIQVEIGKLTALANQWTETLSNAGRILSVGGKQVKPKILSKLNDLIQQSQHKLDFNENS